MPAYVGLPFVDPSAGPAGVPDRPAGLPSVDPALRSVPAFFWPVGDRSFHQPNRSVRETTDPITLDPDLDLWPAVLVRITPFTGAPTEGIWPQGWMLMDDTATLYVCTVAGEPGTWAKVGTGASMAGVSSFDTRTGAVVLEAADVEGLFTAAGEVFQGTGSGTGTLQYPALTQHSGLLGTEYVVTNSFATFLSTWLLDVGTWLVTFSALVSAVTQDFIEIKTVEGTATATFFGPSQGFVQGPPVASSVQALPVSFTFLAVVTSAGALDFQARYEGSGGDAILIALGASVDVTGYTAVRIT
jgi:hypothetical protein